MPKWLLQSRNYFQTASTSLAVRQCMLAACFTVCGREKIFRALSASAFLSSQWDSGAAESGGAADSCLCETSHSTVDSDAAQVTSSYRKADRLPEICVSSLASQNNFNTDFQLANLQNCTSNLTEFLQLKWQILLFRLWFTLAPSVAQTCSALYVWQNKNREGKKRIYISSWLSLQGPLCLATFLCLSCPFPRCVARLHLTPQ